MDRSTCPGNRPRGRQFHDNRSGARGGVVSEFSVFGGHAVATLRLTIVGLTLLVAAGQTLALDLVAMPTDNPFFTD